MINGAHAILNSDDADATRATLAKVLETWSVDAGGGLSSPCHRPRSPSASIRRRTAEPYLMSHDVPLP
jgi:hypothetical protein